MHIISASRRTDIPAFYMDWFMKRLDAGTATYPNPFGGQQHTVSLAPDDVHSIVFWTKNPAPLNARVDNLRQRGYRFVTHVTITGAPRELEPHVPHWETVADAFRALAAHTSPRHVMWRFDPIMLTDTISPADTVARFERIADALDGASTRCMLSFATFYGKVMRRIKQSAITIIDQPLDEKHALLDQLADIADRHNITLFACCQDALLSARIHKAHCIDGDLLAELFPDRPYVTSARPSREGCGCVASRDIGMYDTCPYGCVYCYANTTLARALDNRRRHDPDTPMLLPTHTAHPPVH